MITDNQKICQFGRAAVDKEAEAIASLSSRIDDKFVKACTLLAGCRGRIVVTGIGKSGHIASKIAATLASTGSPAFFLHPAEASHGDLGNVVEGDVMIAVSGSGNTPEILAILPLIKQRQIPLIALTGNSSSNLALAASVNLDVSVKEEACPLGLAPTSSTTAALVMGDALAVSVLNMRGFTAEDFAHNHPGGVLGKRLWLLIDDVMRVGKDIPKVLCEIPISEALVEISQKRMGMTTVVDKNGKLLGIYTDGDLRRTLDKKIDIHSVPIKEAMTCTCKTIAVGALAIEALQIMEQCNITSLVVVKEQVPVGAVHIHDLLKEVG